MADLLVLGLGAVGAFALRAAAAMGARVVGVERFEPGHDRGSSHGGTRIFRHAYFEHGDYVPLLLAATQAFQVLELEAGQPLLQRCGVLLVGGPASAVLGGSQTSAERWHIPVERLDTATLRDRYPQLAVPDGHQGLFEPAAGFVRPEASVRAALAAAERYGAQVHVGCQVLDIHDDAHGVTLTGLGPDGAPRRWRGKRLLVSGGAWTARLLPALAPLLRVTRQVQGWVSGADPVLSSAARLPCWLVDQGAGRHHLYGIPCDPSDPDSPGPKIAVHGSDLEVHPDQVDRWVAPAELARLSALQQRHLPGLGGAVGRGAVCLYTSTSDQHPVLDRAPGLRHTWVVAGLSGHGFKLAPALAAGAVDQALHQPCLLPTRFLRVDRLTR